MARPPSWVPLSPSPWQHDIGNPRAHAASAVIGSKTAASKSREVGEAGQPQAEEIAAATVAQLPVDKGTGRVVEAVFLGWLVLIVAAAFVLTTCRELETLRIAGRRIRQLFGVRKTG